jgi:murein DD-endopeptidase MepM/ murein hydrolase activator NlpD
MSQGLVTPDDASGGFSMQGLDEKDFDALPKEMLKVFKEVEKLVEKIAKDWGKTLDETKETAKIVEGEASGGVGGKMSKSLGKMPAKVGMGIMAVSAAYMSMAPSTMEAVTQRMAADTFAGLSGVRGGSRGAIRQANQMVGGGATSAMGPTMAQATLFSGGGMAAGTVGAKNIMSQMSGMSAFSGMSNEQVASSVSGVNGMSFLRMGIRVRDNNGEIRKTSSLINEVYQFMFRGQKITKSEAAMVYAPRSRANVLLQQISEGDADLFQFLASGIVARASAGTDKKFSGAMNSKDPNKMLDLMGVDKSSPLRSNFNFNTSESKKLLATEKGLVGGYNTSLNAAASLNDGYSKMAGLLGPINDGLMNLKAILQTFPNAGSVAGGVSQIAGAGMNAAMTAAMLRGGGGSAAAAGTTVASKFGSGGAGLFGKFGSTAAKAVPIAGAAMSAFGGYNAAKAKGGFDWGSLLTSTALGAGTGAIMGAGTGPGALVTGLIGGLIGGGSNLVGQLFGKGGERGDSMNLGTGADQAGSGPSPAASPVPSGAPTTSKFGPRPDAAKKAAAKGQRISSYHRGTDYGVPSGTPIKAVVDGVVAEVGSQANGWGNYVLIRHADGSTSRYAHLRSINVSKNQVVKKGDVIGLSGGGPKDPGRGNSTAAHLHFEIANQAGVRVDPESWLANAKIPILAGFNDKGKRFQVGSMLFDSYSSLDDVFSPNSLDNFLKSNADFGGVSWGDITKQYSKQELKSFMDIGDAYKGKPSANKKELMRMIAAGGFRGDALKTAYAISIAESGGRSNAKGDIALQDEKWGPSVGLFQIRSLKNWKKWNDPYRDASRLQDPTYNIEAAWTKSKQGTNFKPWTTYTGGSFVKHLAEADAMAKSAGVGGGSDAMNVGVASGGVATMSQRSGGSGTVTANSNVTINLDMKVSIASSGPAEAERLVRMVGEKLKNDAEIRRIAGNL